MNFIQFGAIALLSAPAGIGGIYRRLAPAGKKKKTATSLGGPVTVFN